MLDKPIPQDNKEKDKMIINLQNIITATKLENAKLWHENKELQERILQLEYELAGKKGE